MAIKIVKNSVNQPTTSQRRATPGRSQARRSPSGYRPQQQRYQKSSSGGGSGKVIAIVVILMVFLGIVIIASTTGKKNRTPQARYAPQPVKKSKYNKDGLERLDSLGGLTMGEWEKLHNKDNAALKARQARRRNPGSYK